MNVESYIKAMAKAGISRGQLQTHFKGYDHTIPPNSARVDQDAPMTVTTPPLEEDWSHLNSTHWKKLQAQGSQGGVKSSAKARRKARPNPCTAMVKWVKAVVWKPA